MVIEETMKERAMEDLPPPGLGHDAITGSPVVKSTGAIDSVIARHFC